MDKAKLKIGVIGTGSVGTALGSRWAQGGHTVTFGSRKPEGPNEKTQAEAAQISDVVLLATPWPVTLDVVRSLGNLNGKIVIDAVNPLLPQLAGMEIGTTTSAAEEIAKVASGAKVVKAFNTVGSNIMADASFPEGKPVLFYAGDDAEAKSVVHALAEELGFDARDLGPLKQARLLEPFALLWIMNALKVGREIAFKFMQRG